MHKTCHTASARERSRASARAKVEGKEQAKVKTMGAGLRPELGLDELRRLRRPVTVVSSHA